MHESVYGVLKHMCMFWLYKSVSLVARMRSTNAVVT